MDNSLYYDIIKGKLIDYGIDSVYIDSYTQNIIDYGNQKQISIISLIEDGISRELLHNAEISDVINDVRKNTSMVSFRQFNPTPNIYVKRNII